MLTNKTAQAFESGGALAQYIQGYRLRTSQQKMAIAVAETITALQMLVVEAGTGVGKTFAYLIPALLSNKQVIISTGSKNLQEQLFFKDLPALCTLLELSPRLSLLKGRSNYLCQLLLESQLLGCDVLEPKVVDELLRINQWSMQTSDGDFGSLISVSENSAAIPLVASSREKCTGQQCAFYAACFSRKARNQAMNAKLIVVNHHLFFADRVVKETGFAELLPDADVVIFDEAHQLPDIAVNYFGQQLSARSIIELLENLLVIYRVELRDSPQIEVLTRRCISQFNLWHQYVHEGKQTDWRTSMGNADMAASSWALLSELKALQHLLEHHLGRSESLDPWVVKLTEYAHKLAQFFHCDNERAAYSIEFSYRFFTMRVAPIDVIHECKKLFDSQSAWIFTSATLQINRDLSLFSRSLGLDKAKELLLDSPFDYANHALLCVPRHLSKVSDQASAVRDLVSIAAKAIEAAKGRTFILFTSHRMMNAVAIELSRRVQYPLLVQGQASKQGLLTKYRQLGNAVLLGTGAFWEGVDVRGKLLSCVIIDKLPFISPDDPLYRARADSLIREGKDPFAMLSLPQAVIALNQGVGRLIRDESDKGVLIICDNRIVNRDYGQAFLHSLPPMARTRSLDKALNFLSGIK